jgi:hypothetical protein
VSKDRSAPFSRKHRRYWLPVTGGMLLIGAINVGIGYCSYPGEPAPPQKIILVLPPPSSPEMLRPRPVAPPADPARAVAPAR